jgi:hypothetical protein
MSATSTIAAAAHAACEPPGDEGFGRGMRGEHPRRCPNP